MNNTEHSILNKEQLKKIKKNEYMRNYMRKYNEKRKPRRVKLTKEQRMINLKNQQKEYYTKNREVILKKKSIINRKKRIEVLQAELNGIINN